MPLAAPYLLSLCEQVETSDFPFGVVSRLRTHTSSLTIKAAKLIHSIVTFSLASESVAIEFLHELQKVSGVKDLVTPVVSLKSELPEEEWAQQILEFLRNRETETLKAELKPVVDLAGEYLNHLLIAARNPGGKKTPQVSIHATPDIERSWTIQQLLNEAVINRRQSPLKELILRRDGYKCPFTGYPFQQETGPSVIPRCAHILPFSFHEKRLLESFTGFQAISDIAIARINDPCNAFNMQSDAHDYFDQLAWGIEAREQPGGEWKYFYHQVRNRSAYTIRLKDGDEIFFGQGQDGNIVEPPHPLFCNVKLAVARVMHACGASDLVDELYGDGDDDGAIATLPVYLGGPFVSDDILLRRLHDRLPVS